jgi:hypothetical protein
MISFVFIKYYSVLLTTIRGLSLGRILEAAIKAEFKEEANTKLAVLNDREKARYFKSKSIMFCGNCGEYLNL